MPQQMAKQKAFANDNPSPAQIVNCEKHEPCCYNLPLAKQQNAVCGLLFAARKKDIIVDR
jgi:hypothetical protein